MPTRVTVWNENVHEREEPAVAERYPTGIHGTIAAHLEGPDREVRTATLQEPEHGLDEATLDATDVLVWWSHCANDEVTDAVAERVKVREKRTYYKGQGIRITRSRRRPARRRARSAWG